MQHIDLMEKLEAKIEEFLQSYNNMKSECEQLRREVVTCKAQNEEKDQEIERLRQELADKNAQIDAIIKKIEAMMS